MVSYTDAVLQGRFSGASLLKKVVRFCVRSTKEILVIMPALNLSLLKLFVMDFIG